MDSSQTWDLTRQQSWRDVSAGRIFAAALLLTLVRLALIVLGFQRAIRLVRWFSRGAQRDKIREEDLAAAAYTVAAAGVFVPYARCLERSLVLFCQLKRKGVPVVLRLGALAYPFAAHAWVEYNGEPVNERREAIRYFSPIFEVH